MELKEIDCNITMSRINNELTVYITHSPTGITASANDPDKSTYALIQKAKTNLEELLAKATVK